MKTPEKNHSVTVWLALKHAFPHVYVFFFHFFLCVNSNFIWIYCLHTVHHYSYTVHVLKNIKNGSHDTIYTFKNYFATIFSVLTTISSIQTHPQCSLILARDETSSSITSESDKPSANEFLFFYFFILLSRIQQTNY